MTKKENDILRTQINNLNHKDQKERSRNDDKNFDGLK